MLNKKAALLLVLPFVFLLFTVSCATRRDISALSRQIELTNKQVYKLSGVRDSQADTGAELDNIKRELRRLSGMIEENRHMIQNAAATGGNDPESLNARLSALEQKVARLSLHETVPQAGSEIQPPVPGLPVTTGQTMQQPSVETPSLDSPEKTLYDQSLAMYNEGRYDEAILGFKNLINKYPQSNLADNAQFWIGECYMAMKKYEQAIQAYHEVEIKYPQGNKVPNAMLKMGLAFLETKEKELARIVLKKLIKNYPDSDESKLAEAKLKTF